MVSNGKYDRIAPLLESNTIKQYSDIFDIIAGIKTDVARDLNININRLTQLIASPGNFKMRKVIQQSELFNMPLVQMVQLIEKQHLAKKKKSNPDEKDKRYLQIKTMAKIGEIKTLTDLFKYCSQIHRCPGYQQGQKYLEQLWQLYIRPGLQTSRIM